MKTSPVSAAEKNNVYRHDFSTKTVYRSNSDRQYCKLDNETLRIKIPGEDRVTAKDIWLDALTCRADWQFTTKGIAKRWGITIKQASKKLTLLVKGGYAVAKKIIDQSSGKILKHVWLFFEKPQPQKKGHGENEVEAAQGNDSEVENHSPKKRDVVPIYKNKQEKKDQWVSFSEIDFDGCENEIRSKCEMIKRLPRKKIPFWPLGTSKAMIQSGIPAKAVLKALVSMLKDWQDIDYNPRSVFEKRCERHSLWLLNKEQIDNARSEERKNEQFKADIDAMIAKGYLINDQS